MAHVDLLNPGECIRDYTFDIMANSNEYIRTHKSTASKLITISNYCMDFTQIIGIAYIVVERVSYKNAIGFTLFFPTRQALQNIFLMRRLETWTWFDTGFFSLTVPFHDTNDFYFSGHLGVCVLYCLDFYHNNYKVMSCYTLFNLIFQWWFLGACHSHYIIDLITGLFIAHLFSIMSEYLSYFVDVKILGLPNKYRNF